MNIGVRYTGSFFDSSGYGSANRAFITALYIAGVDVTTELAVHMRERTYFGWEGELCNNLQNRNIPYKVKIIHLTPDLYPNYLEKGKYHIGHLFWETDKLPAYWAEHCNQLQEIWTSSENMANLFRRSGVTTTIKAFPQPIDITLPDKERETFSIPQHKGFLFYSIFQWIERKNPKLLLQAYWEAFDGVEDVSLLLKTFRLSYDKTEFDRIRNDLIIWRNELKLKRPPKVLITHQLLDQEGIYKLHQTGDCFVVAHRGEGWGRPVQEALLMEKPVIATARGGVHEYLQDGHYFPIGSTYVPVQEVPYIKFYTKDQNWAEADKEQLKKAMQFVYSNYEIAKSKGLTASGYIKERFSYHRVGQLMRERLEEIYRKL